MKLFDESLIVGSMKNKIETNLAVDLVQWYAITDNDSDEA